MKKVMYLCFILTSTLVGCSAHHFNYEISSPERDTIARPYLLMSYIEDTMEIFSVPEMQISYDMDGVISDTSHTKKKLRRRFVYSVDKKNGMVVYRSGYPEENDCCDSLIFRSFVESTQVRGVPFYFLPYKGYYNDFHNYSNDNGANIHASYKGREKVVIGKKKITAERVEFSYEGFPFDQLKPDIMYFDSKTLLPIMIQYNSIDEYWLRKDFSPSHFERKEIKLVK